jgi:hypothetical protein
VTIRDRSEIAELYGADGELEAVTLRRGERLALSFLLLFLGALPCTDRLAHVVARHRNGSILTGTNAAGESLLKTGIPGVFAAGDVRSGVEQALRHGGRERAMPCSSCTLGWRPSIETDLDVIPLGDRGMRRGRHTRADECRRQAGRHD